MFALSEDALDPAALRPPLADPAGGAVVTFEGRVRNHNEGRAVLRLEYEGSPEIAANEFARIEAELRAAHNVLHIVCVHRVGLLQVGDLAVWAGVSAAHRADAFQACRVLIDELKARLPIWKKETYTDGQSGWINHP